MWRDIQKKVFDIGTVVITLLVVLCGVNHSMAADKINYRLKWLYNASVIGDIYAEDQGYFANKDLQVTVKEGGPERDAIRELELGHAQFGVASADQVIRAYEKGSPLVVIAQLFQVNPLHWIYRSKNLNIKSLADLKGKILGITYGGNDENIMRTLLAKAEISESEVTLFSVRYDFTPFYQKKVDIWPCYLNTQGVILKEKLNKEGEEVAFFNPAEHGVKFVANSVVTSVRIMEERTDLVKRFVDALTRGWHASLKPDNENKALQTLKKFEKETAPHIQQAQLAATRKLIQPTPDFRIGSIDIAAWKQTEKIMLKQKQISKPVYVEKILKQLPEFHH
jgi:NitT/TauT family transport system substrate-binding protein